MFWTVEVIPNKRKRKYGLFAGDQRPLEVYLGSCGQSVFSCVERLKYEDDFSVSTPQMSSS